MPNPNQPKNEQTKSVVEESISKTSSENFAEQLAQMKLLVQHLSEENQAIKQELQKAIPLERGKLIEALADDLKQLALDSWVSLKDTVTSNVLNTWQTLKEVNQEVYDISSSMQPTTGTLGGDVQVVGKAVGTGAVVGAVGAYKAGETVVKGIAGATVYATDKTVGKISRAAEERFIADAKLKENAVSERDKYIERRNQEINNLESNALEAKRNAKLEKVHNTPLPQKILEDMKLEFLLTPSGQQVFDLIDNSEKPITYNDIVAIFNSDGVIDNEEGKILKKINDYIELGIGVATDLNILEKGKVSANKFKQQVHVAGKHADNLVDTAIGKTSDLAGKVVSVANMDVKDVWSATTSRLGNLFNRKGNKSSEESKQE